MKITEIEKHLMWFDFEWWGLGHHDPNDSTEESHALGAFLEGQQAIFFDALAQDTGKRYEPAVKSIYTSLKNHMGLFGDSVMYDEDHKWTAELWLTRIEYYYPEFKEAGEAAGADEPADPAQPADPAIQDNPQFKQWIARAQEQGLLKGNVWQGTEILLSLFCACIYADMGQYKAKGDNMEWKPFAGCFISKKGKPIIAEKLSAKWSDYKYSEEDYSNSSLIFE